MHNWNYFAKILIGLGLFSLIAGSIMLIFGKIFPFGRLPGDFYYQKGNFSFYFPLASGLIISLVLTILLNLLFRK